MKIILNIIKIQIWFPHRALLAARRKGDFLEKLTIRNQKKVSPSTVNLDPDPLHKQHHRHLVDHLVGAEDEDASSEERQNASDEDEGAPVVKVRRLHYPSIIMMHDQDCHLLKLLHDGLVHHEADDEADAHHQEEDGADGVHHQVDGEVPHLGDLTLD